MREPKWIYLQTYNYISIRAYKLWRQNGLREFYLYTYDSLSFGFFSSYSSNKRTNRKDVLMYLCLKIVKVKLITISILYFRAKCFELFCFKKWYIFVYKYFYEKRLCRIKEFNRSFEHKDYNYGNKLCIANICCLSLSITICTVL